MSIELHCDSCGRLVRAPREAAGKRGQCPYCGKSVYIPMPEAELEELPLAPDDAEDRRRQEMLQEERRRLDRVLAQAREAPEGEASSAARPREVPRAAQSGGASLEEVVFAYLGAMRNSDLGRAENFLGTLQRHRAEARAIVDRLAADQIPPATMSGVPAAVYQGFLKSLRAQL